jgi:hypothetical protein
MSRLREAREARFSVIPANIREGCGKVAGRLREAREARFSVTCFPHPALREGLREGGNPPKGGSLSRDPLPKFGEVF